MYEIGQLIVYGNEGVCRVEEIGTPKISGVDKHRDYYTLAPIYREGKVFTPVDSKVFMRPVISRALFQKFLKLSQATHGR